MRVVLEKNKLKIKDMFHFIPTLIIYKIDYLLSLLNIDQDVCI